MRERTDATIEAARPNLAGNKGPDDRRRSARFICGGDAKISRLPSDGSFLPGKVLDLSLHGCRVDTTLPINYGGRAEIVLRVNATSIRAVGEVREIRDAGAGIEFIQLSRSGKDVLADLVQELAHLQASMNQFRKMRRERNAESVRAQLENGKLLASRLCSRLACLETVLADESARENTGLDDEASADADEKREKRSEAAQTLVIAVDLFG